MRRAAALALAAIVLVLLFADFVAPYSYATQFRDAPSAAPSARFPLGTDAIGRDRLSRLLYGGRISILLAPAAALIAVALALLAGLAAALLGGWCERAVTAAADLCVSLPWLFLVIAARALLPLDADPTLSLVVTFGLLGCLGWAGPSRIIVASVKSHLASDFVLQARSSGCSPLRLAVAQIAPNLAPLVTAQFWIAAPAFLLSEATLGLLGLGVAEPLPSWGNLLREMENVTAVAANPWMAAPVLLLIVVVSCSHLVVSAEEYGL
jgi:peptide/nickel transport system permease protein